MTEARARTTCTREGLAALLLALVVVIVVVGGAADVRGQDVRGPDVRGPDVRGPDSSAPAGEATAPVDSTEPSLLPTIEGPAAAPRPTLAPQPSPSPSREPAGFGQDADDEPRCPRIRLEIAYLGAALDSLARIGHTGASNTISPHADLHVPRWFDGERGEVVIKLHRWFAIGAEYLDIEADGPREYVRRNVRLGGAVPTEVPNGYRASGTVEMQEAHLSLRLVLADEARYRAEFVLGSSWVSYRLAVHPAQPLATPPLPGFGQPTGTSRRVETFFGPTLGLFFCWNIVDELAVFLEQHSGYLSVRLGSIESLVRFGFRVKVAAGLEVVLGAFLMDGQFYDFEDRYSSRAKGHIHRSVYWLGGGPDVGLSFTY